MSKRRSRGSKSNEAESEDVVEEPEVDSASKIQRIDHQPNNELVQTASSSLPLTTKQVMFKEIAERRAGHFARFNRSTSSTTPTGVRQMSSSGKTGETDEMDGQESWPGPFSTAHDLVQKRDNAKKLREEALSARIKEAENGSVILGDNSDYDEYEKACLALQPWSSISLPGGLEAKTTDQRIYSISSLSVSCVRQAVASFDNLAGLSENSIESTIPLSLLPSQLRIDIAEGLARKRLLTKDRILALYSLDDGALALPDCSQVDETDMLAILSATAPLSSSNSSSLSLLDLQFCGHSFGDYMAKSLSEYTSLERVRLHGLYRISDESLSNTLRAISNNLLSLDLSCAHNTLGENTLKTIRSIPNLRELTLDFACGLNDESLLALYHPESDFLRNLQLLSLSNLLEVSDASIIPIIKCFGPKLLSLNINGCIKLTDASIEALQQSCSQLRSLNVGGLIMVTSVAWENFFSLCDLHNIEMIKVSWLPDLNDTAMIGLIKQCNALASLDISGSCSLTSKSVVALAMHCSSSITELDLSFVRKINENSLAHLIHESFMKGEGVKKINLWGCSQFSKALLNRFIMHYNVSIIGQMPGL